jgi:hypothetical protein
MPRKTPIITIDEVPGTKYPDLESAQLAALSDLSADLAETIRRLLAEGWLINDNERIIPNPERIHKK